LGSGPVNHLHPLPVSSERGVAVTHTTIMRRVLRHVPEDEKRSGR
jgi:transposase-like protein